MATPRVLAEVKKAFEYQAQIVAKLEGAPDPKTDPDGYRSRARGFCEIQNADIA